MFTSAHQVVNVLRMAEQLDVTRDLRRQMSRMVVASIGPTTSETLRDNELQVDVEPEHSKMGQLVIAAAEQGRELCHRKQHLSSLSNGAAQSATAKPTRGPWNDSLFMKACRREPVDARRSG